MAADCFFSNPNNCAVGDKRGEKRWTDGGSKWQQGGKNYSYASSGDMKSVFFLSMPLEMHHLHVLYIKCYCD